MARDEPLGVRSSSAVRRRAPILPEVDVVNIGRPKRIIEIAPEELPLPDPAVPMPEPGPAPVEPSPAAVPGDPVEPPRTP